MRECEQVCICMCKYERACVSEGAYVFRNGRGDMSVYYGGRYRAYLFPSLKNKYKHSLGTFFQGKLALLWKHTLAAPFLRENMAFPRPWASASVLPPAPERVQMASSLMEWRSHSKRQACSRPGTEERHEHHFLPSIKVVTPFILNTWLSTLLQKQKRESYMRSKFNMTFMPFYFYN